MSRFAALWRAGLALLGGVVLAACSELVGEGTKPVALTVSLDGQTGEHETFECASFQLTAVARSEGDAGTRHDEVTSRTQWRSSNPGIIDVSNGAGLPAGTVSVRSAGSAVIEGEFGQLMDAISINAEALPELWIEPAMTLLAPESRQRFEMKARLESNEPPVDLTGAAQWRLPSIHAPAELVGTSTIETRRAGGGPFLLEAGLPCNRAAQIELRIGEVERLALRYEQAAGTLLPVGLGDELVVEALFTDPDAPPQNLSGQLEIERLLGRERDSELAPTDEFLLLSGLADGALAQFSLSFEPLLLSVDTRLAEFSELFMMELRVTPEDPVLMYPDDDEFQLEAFAVFEDGIERPVHRTVQWSSLAPDVAEVVESGPLGGTLRLTGIGGTARIEARGFDRHGKEILARTDVRVRRR